MISSKRSRACAAREPEHDRVDHHVVARGQVRVEADAELDERRQPARRRRRRRRRPGRSRRGTSAACSCRSRCGRRCRRTRRAATSTETSSTARSSSNVRERNGCSARSLSVEYRWCGSRNVLLTPSTVMAAGRCEVADGARGASGAAAGELAASGIGASLDGVMTGFVDSPEQPQLLRGLDLAPTVGTESALVGSHL